MCVCVSIHLQAIWENQFYYLFGFLFLVFIILVVSCSQISIVMVYFQLCAEVSSLIAYYCLWLPGFYLTYTHISHIVGYVFHLCGTYLILYEQELMHSLVSLFFTVRITGGGGELSWFQEARLSMSLFTPFSTLSTR